MQQLGDVYLDFYFAVFLGLQESMRVCYSLFSLCQGSMTKLWVLQQVCLTATEFSKLEPVLFANH